MSIGMLESGFSKSRKEMQQTLDSISGKEDGGIKVDKIPDFLLNLKSVLKFKVIDLPWISDTEELERMMKQDWFIPVTDEFKDELQYVCESILVSIFPNTSEEDDLSLDLDTIL